MTKTDVEADKRFVPAILPWIIAGGATAIYLATLNHWVSFNSLQQVAKASGWIWQPELSGPLCWLLMYPLRWLPTAAVPLGVNLFSLVCAVLTLALLARSVALLPHDRTQDQRDKAQNSLYLLGGPIAWVPPVLAAIVCGLQLTFWEYATAGSGNAMDALVAPFANKCEMLELLLFAYVIRCLLEFRVSRSDSWLYRAGLVYGLGLTGNWALLLFFPLFLVALVWAKRAAFFNQRFLGKFSLWLLAGLSLYLLLPLVCGLAGTGQVTFWTALKTEVILQKTSVSMVYRQFSSDKQEALLLALTSLVPIAILSIRWASSFGESGRLAIGATTMVFHLVHAVVLGICFWVALDPSFSPRSRHYWMPCLTLAYLGAISVGYFSGYLLLVFGGPAPTRTLLLVRWFRVAVRSVVWLLLAAAPVMLIWRNLPQVQFTNGSLLRQYVAAQAEMIPGGNTILLSDDSRLLILLRSYLATQPGRGDCVLLDTSALSLPDYHRLLARRYGTRWPLNPPKEARQRLADLDLIGLVSNLRQSNSVYYLHPSFGYYFEVFDPEPHGLLYKLNPCSTNSITAAPLTPALVSENEAFWTRVQQAFGTALPVQITPRAGRVGLLAKVLDRLHLDPEPNHDAMEMGNLYSRALNWWGVQLQRQGELEKAGARFGQALALNPENLAAQENLASNEKLRAGQREELNSETVEDKFGGRRRWDQVLNGDGPFDEASFSYRQGLIFSQGRLYRQAAHEFARVATLVPLDLGVRLMLAKMNVLRGLPAGALQVAADIRAQARALGLGRTNAAELLLVETAAHLVQHDTRGAENTVTAAVKLFPDCEELLPTAARVYSSYGIWSNALTCLQGAMAARPNDSRLVLMEAQVYASAKEPAGVSRVLQTLTTRFPDDENTLAAAAEVYLSAGLFSNVVAISERQLKLNPGNAQALANEGYASLQLGGFDDAVAQLTRAIEVDTNSTPTLRTFARLNRAVAYLRHQNLESARRDYEALKRDYPGAYQVYYGLQEIAYQKKAHSEAARYCRLYLTYAPTNTDEAKLISARLKELSGSR